MEQASLQPEPIELPDITNAEAFEKWLDRYVDRPIVGFEDKKHPDGTPLSYKELVQATRDQFRQIVRDGSLLAAESRRGSSHTPEIIAQSLVEAVEFLRRDSPPPPEKSG